MDPMDRSHIPVNIDPELLNVIEDLLNACRDASALLVGVAEEEERRFKRNAAMNVRDVEKALTGAICRGMSVCGERIPSGRESGVAVDPQAVREAAPDLFDALQSVSLTVAIHAARNPADREAQQDLAKVRAALRKATTVRKPEIATLVSVPAAEPAFFQQFNYVADGVAKTRDGKSVVSIGPAASSEHILVSANALVALLLVAGEMKRMMIPYKDGFAVDQDVLNRALAAADYAFYSMKADNGGVEPVLNFMSAAVETINATVIELNSSRVSRVHASDSAISSPTNDPAHGGPGGGMGDAAAAMPVPGCTVGNELHSRPLTRGEAAVGQKLDVTA